MSDAFQSFNKDVKASPSPVAIPAVLMSSASVSVAASALNGSVLEMELLLARAQKTGLSAQSPSQPNSTTSSSSKSSRSRSPKTPCRSP